MPLTGHPDTADAVVVGGGTVGGWCAYFLRQDGLRVILVEKGQLGQGASSRAAGVVRAQGGTPEAVRLGQWSQHFYRRQRDELGIDSGFVAQGYLLPCFTEAEVARPGSGWPCSWTWGWTSNGSPGRGGPAQPDPGPRADPGRHLLRGRRLHHPAAQRDRLRGRPGPGGVAVREQVRFLGLRHDGARVTGIDTSAGPIAAGSVVLTGGPKLAEVGRLAGLRIPVGGARHQVAVTQPHPDLDPARVPMVFDLASGLYWRPEEGGLLFGMSNPEEPPGWATEVDEAYLALMRTRLGGWSRSPPGSGCAGLGGHHRLHP